MAKTKEQKKNDLENLREKVKKQKVSLFVDFTGLKVDDMSRLRKDLKKNDSELKVAKKTMIKLALKDAGLEVDTGNMKGEVAMVMGYKDEIAPAKMIYNFSKTNPNLKILGGIFENQLKPAEDFIALAQLPSKQELLARLVGSVSSPISGFVRTLEGNIKGLVYALSAIKKA